MTENGRKLLFRLGESVRFADSSKAKPSERGTGVIMGIPAGDDCNLYVLHRIVFDDGHISGCSRQFVEAQLEML
jgi:hypothetical protein